MRTYWLIVDRQAPLYPMYLKPHGGWTRNPQEARKYNSKDEVFDVLVSIRAKNPMMLHLGFCQFIKKTDPRRW